MRKLKKLLLYLLVVFLPIQVFAWSGMPTLSLHVDGKSLKDPCGNIVLLHGAAITPSP